MTHTRGKLVQLKKEVKMAYYYRRGKTFYFKNILEGEYPSKLNFTLEVDDDKLVFILDEWGLQRGEVYSMEFAEES